MATFEFIKGYHAILPRHCGCVATLGSFDGMHLGHKGILRRLVAKGAQLGLPALVILFEPQPAEFFNRQQAPARLMRLREKIQALRDLGVARVLCLKFNAALRDMTAAQFVDDILVAKLGVAHVEVGDDFRFGRGREGDFAYLSAAATRHGFTLANSHTFSASNARVSSTRIRQLLAADQLTEAAELLGQPFTMTGRVLYGRQLARTFNAPTANIAIGRFSSPLRGVYAVRVRGEFGMGIGVANLGIKPSVANILKPLLEVFIFDFDQDIYGSCLTVEFCYKLREEQKFPSLEALKQQIAQDIQAGRDYFASVTHTP